ncbi:MAG: hypothetical protein KDK91_26470 [Gammaproteobacteria bacterium]|nr:hypothetical protein [Gammaproteobacteria bacterium]
MPEHRPPFGSGADRTTHDAPADQRGRPSTSRPADAPGAASGDETRNESHGGPGGAATTPDARFDNQDVEELYARLRNRFMRDLGASQASAGPGPDPWHPAAFGTSSGFPHGAADPHQSTRFSSGPGYGPAGALFDDYLRWLQSGLSGGLGAFMGEPGGPAGDALQGRPPTPPHTPAGAWSDGAEPIAGVLGMVGQAYASWLSRGAHYLSRMAETHGRFCSRALESVGNSGGARNREHEQRILLDEAMAYLREMADLSQREARLFQVELERLGSNLRLRFDSPGSESAPDELDAHGPDVAGHSAPASDDDAPAASGGPTPARRYARAKP